MLKIISLFLLLSSNIIAQDSISLDQCYLLAKENYPLVKQLGLITKIKDLNLDNLSKGYLPQISINGQATYQSEVTSLPISIPNVEVPSLSKDQYKIYADIYQNLYDGNAINKQKQLTIGNSEVEQEKTEVELYKLKGSVNQLFFGVLMIDAQKSIIDLLSNDIQNALKKTNAVIKNGIALPSQASILEAELLKISQRQTEIASQRTAYINMLSLITNKVFSEETKFIRPSGPLNSDVNTRPELRLFEAQQNIFSIQNDIITAKNSIRVGLFVQAGYGRPAFNFLSNSFSPYFIGGVKFSWNLSNIYTSKNEKALLILNKNSIDIQRKVFLRNTEITLKQQEAEINKFRDLIATDNAIIKLRLKVLQASESQLLNGTISINDYLTNVNALDQAKQSQIVHELQLLQSQINYQNSLGN